MSNDISTRLRATVRSGHACLPLGAPASGTASVLSIAQSFLSAASLKFPSKAPPRNKPRPSSRGCRRDRRARPALLPGRRAERLGRRIRRAAPAQRGDRGALSRPAHARKPVAQGRRGAGRALRQGAPRRADALARQCVQRRGRRRFRRSHPPLPAALPRTSRSSSPPSRRSTGSRVAALRGRRARQRRNARRRQARARTSPPTSARSRTCRTSSRARAFPTSARCAAKST